MKIDQQVNKMHLSIVAVTLDKAGNRIQKVFPDIPVTEKQPTTKNRHVQYKIFTKTDVRNQLIQFFDPDVMTRNTTTRRLPVWLVGSIFPDKKKRPTRHVLYMISNTVLGRSMYQNGNVTNVDTTHLDRLPLVSTNGIVELYRYIITIGFEKASPQKQLQTRSALEIRPLLLQRALGVDRINTYHGNKDFHSKIQRGLIRRSPDVISKKSTNQQRKRQRTSQNLSIATTSRDPYPVPLTQNSRERRKKRVVYTKSTGTYKPVAIDQRLLQLDKVHDAQTMNKTPLERRMYVRLNPQTLKFAPRVKVEIFYPKEANLNAVMKTVTRIMGNNYSVLPRPYTQTGNRKTVSRVKSVAGVRIRKADLLIIAPDPMTRIPVKEVKTGIYIPVDLEHANLRPLVNSNGRMDVFYNSKKQQDDAIVHLFLNGTLGVKLPREVPYTVKVDDKFVTIFPRGKEKLIVFKPTGNNRIPVMRLDRLQLYSKNFNFRRLYYI
jgi:hypothetical protein